MPPITCLPTTSDWPPPHLLEQAESVCRDVLWRAFGEEDEFAALMRDVRMLAIEWDLDLSRHADPELSPRLADIRSNDESYRSHLERAAGTTSTIDAQTQRSLGGARNRREWFRNWTGLATFRWNEQHGPAERPSFLTTEFTPEAAQTELARLQPSIPDHWPKHGHANARGMIEGTPDQSHVTRVYLRLWTPHMDGIEPRCWKDGGFARVVAVIHYLTRDYQKTGRARTCREAIDQFVKHLNSAKS